MKKNRSIQTAAHIIAILALFASAAFAADGVKIVSVSGSVQYAEGELKEWKPLTKETKLREGNAVVTGKDGEAVLQWFSGNVVKLSPLTDLAITELALDDKAGTEKSSLSLTQGRIHAKAKKLANEKSTFTVRTPSAIAGVRGTEFTAAHTLGETSTFTVLSGSLMVSVEEVTQMLDAEFSLSIDLDKAMGEVQPVPPEELNEMKQEFEKIDEAVEAEGAAAGTAEEKAATEKKEEPEEEKETPADAQDVVNEVENLVIDEVLQKDTEDMMIDNITTPATDCCDY
ncbi:MAG: FecR family protein [bacterium]